MFKNIQKIHKNIIYTVFFIIWSNINLIPFWVGRIFKDIKILNYLGEIPKIYIISVIRFNYLPIKKILKTQHEYDDKLLIECCIQAIWFNV